MMQLAYLIDAPAFFFKYFFSMPDHWHSQCGNSTSSVLGFSRWLIRFLHDENPVYVGACFDESLGTCFRNDIYADYKYQRPLPDDNIRFQFQACKKICELLGVPTYASSRYEADDLIGTLSMRHKKHKRASVILTRDKDLGQLLMPGDCLWFYPQGEKLKAEDIKQKFGVNPQQIPDYLALCGDPIDDIPGVPGVGAKTAAKLLRPFSNVEQLLAHPERILTMDIRGSARIIENLRCYAGQIAIAKKLATIQCDVALGNRARLKRVRPRKRELLKYVAELGFTIPTEY